MGEEETTWKSDAPFNSAIDCLMRISRILQRLEQVSTQYILHSEIPGVRLSAGQAQQIKARLVKQLYVQAIPLLEAGVKEGLWNRIVAIKLNVIKSYNKTGRHATVIEVFDESIDLYLDKIVIDIEENLQKNNFFMPPKRNAGRAVLQSHN